MRLLKSEARKIVALMARTENSKDLRPLEPIFSAHGVVFPTNAIEVNCARMAFEIGYKLVA